MHFDAAGSGRPVVFLHGNPTSSYLCRKVLAPASFDSRRTIAVDLIGDGRMGTSTGPSARSRWSPRGT